MSRAKTLRRVCQAEDCPVPHHKALKNNLVYFSKRDKQYLHSACRGPNPWARKKRPENRELYKTVRVKAGYQASQAPQGDVEFLSANFLQAVDRFKERR